MHELATLLEKLTAARDDPRAQAAVSAEFALTARHGPEAPRLRAALDAAAVLRWFESALIAGLLEIDASEAAERVRALDALPFVQHYGGRGGELLTVHEATRLGWRIALARDDAVRFRDLSARAAARFAADGTNSGRIETIYHLLCADPDAGATQVESITREWAALGREENHALAIALGELQQTGLLAGRARVWALLTIAWARSDRGETVPLAHADEILELARAARDPRAEADALALCADSRSAQGQLEEARRAFEASLAIREKLTDHAPGDASLQRDRAVTCSRLGALLHALHRLPEAEELLRHGFDILERLAAADPGNEARQRELALAHIGLGAVLQERKAFREAAAAYESAREITERLVQRDPHVARWQRDRAIVSGRIGRLLVEQNRPEEAKPELEKCLTILRQLALRDPTSADTLRELGVAYNRLGRLLESLGDAAGAEAAYLEDLRISRALVNRDPTDCGWQRDLAVAYYYFAQVLEKQNKLAEAEAALAEDLRLSRRLADLQRDNAQWQHDLALALRRSAALQVKLGNDTAALELYRECRTALYAAILLAPHVGDWTQERDSLVAASAEVEARLQGRHEGPANTFSQTK